MPLKNMPTHSQHLGRLSNLTTALALEVKAV